MRLWGLALVGSTMLGACSRPAIGDPQVAAAEYAAAAERGDADAIYRQLSSEARRTYGRDGVRQLVGEARGELQRQGRALGTAVAAGRARTETAVRVRFADGEEAELVVKDGRLRISSAAGLPAEATTPAQALAQLRAALARRSYAALVRVLASETRSALQSDLGSLVGGLEEPDALDIVVDGDRARVEVPGGHWVKLRREAGVWRVEDFD